MLDPAKLADPTNRGIFENDASAYADYADWRAHFLGTLRAIIELDQFSSFHDTSKVKAHVLGVDPSIPRERVFNTVMAEMIERGASWYHLAALMVLAGYKKNPFPQHAGRFYLLISDWIIWYENKLDESNRPEVAIADNSTEST